LQLFITASPICFESYHAIIRDTNIREQAGRQVEAANRGREADTQKDRQSGADGSRQPHKNRETETENGRQSRIPGWVQVGRLILGRGIHGRVGRQTDRLIYGKIEEGRRRHAVRQAYGSR
jgi:hypothetical protein